MAYRISDRSCTCVHIISVTIFIVLVGGLTTLPTIFYAVSPPEGSTTVPPVNSTTENSSTPEIVTSGNCSATEYAGSVCRDVLLDFQSCIPERANSSTVYISKGDTQAELEVSAQTIIPLLQSGASQECAEVAVPLLCLFFLGLCDESGNEYLPSRSQCEDVSLNVCPSEWQFAMSAFSDLVPQCELLPETSVQCNSTTMMRKQGRRRQATLTCSEDFYFDVNTSTCLAECGEWSPYSDLATRVADAVIIILCSLSIVATIGTLILACVHHKRVLKFPTIFVIYTSVTVCLLSIMILIGYTDRKGLFCISRNFADINFEKLRATIAGPTPFCTAAGVVNTYLVLQLAFWWICHTASVFWCAVFPFHFQKTVRNGRVKLVLIIITIVGATVPCVPFVATLSTAGFADGMTFPPYCLPVDVSVTYYTRVLPTSIILALGLILLAIFLSRVIRISSSAPNRSKTAEIKVFILLCYFATVGVVYGISYCVFFWKVDQYVAEMSRYFVCELGGVQSAGVDGCDRSGFQSTAFPTLLSVAIGLAVLFPVTNLIYITDIEGVKAKYMKLKTASCGKHESSPLDSPNGISLSSSQVRQLTEPVVQISLVTSVSPSEGTVTIHEDSLDFDRTAV